MISTSNKRVKYLSALILLLGLILAGCQGETDPTAVPPEDPPDVLPTETTGTALGQPFSLLVGESATIDGTELTVTFEKVERDGRCPSAVNCAEEGPVVVVISVSDGDQTATDFEMNPDANMAAFFGIPNVVTYGNYQIELTAVDPFPEEPEDLMNLPYAVTLVVGKATDQTSQVGSPIVLSVGDTADVVSGNLSLTFDSVVSDERCPTEVECEYAGPVVIQVTAVEGGQRISTFTMNPEPGLAGTDGTGATVVTLSDYLVELTAVDPFPVKIEDRMNMDYEAVFMVTAKN